MKNDDALSQTLTIGLMLLMTIGMAVAITGVIFGEDFIQKKAAYISADINQLTPIDKNVIQLSHKAGDSVNLANDPQLDFMNVFVDTPSGSYLLTPPAGVGEFKPGMNLFIYNSTGGYVLTADRSVATAANSLVPIRNVGVRLVDNQTHQLIAQWHTLDVGGGGAVIASPTVTSISPSSGPTTGGTSVTISGTNLIGATTVTFDGTSTGFSVIDASSITATTPVHAAPGTVDITVTTPNGTASAPGAYTYAAPPTFGGITPASGLVTGGTPVSITGTNFVSGGSFGVTIDGSNAAAVFVDSSHITATTPASTAGAKSVVITNNDGQTAIGTYTYYASPAISSVNPASGPTAGGTSVAISGTNLAGATIVTFGGTNAVFTVVDTSSIIATTPVYVSPGAVDIVITTINGTATATGAYKYISAPTFGGITPSSGTVNGNTPVTITGTNFVSGGSFGVTIGGSNAAGVVVDSSHITATTPAGTAGAKSVVITNNDGQTTTGTFTYVADQIITTSAGTGGTITPSGPVSVQYGSSQAFAIAATDGYDISDVVIDSTTHLGAVTSYTFSNVQGAHTIGATFTKWGAPTVSSISPTPRTRGSTYTETISGTNFRTGARVKLGTNTACTTSAMTLTVTTVSSTSITGSLTIPSSQSQTTYYVCVTNTDTQTGRSSSKIFRVQ